MLFQTKQGKKLMSIIAALAAFVVIGGSGSQIAVSAATISSGTSSSQVTALQTKLKSLGYFKATCTGYYGSITKTAVAKYQSANGLTATGEVDSATYSLLFGASSSGSSSSSSSSSYTGTGTVTASYLNVRSGAGMGYSIIGGLPKGSKVTITGKSGSWYKIKLSSGSTGYVSSSYVNTSGSSTSSTTTTSTTTSSTSVSSSGKITITASTLNVRSGAGTGYSIISSVNKNEVYSYSSYSNGWYKITLSNGKTGYVSSSYVKKFSSYAVSGGGSYIWPVQSSTNISSYYGARNGSTHYGIDIAAKSGAQIIAVASGTVVTKAYDASGYGYYIVVKNSDGICTYYAHMKAASKLSVGDTVKAGDIIGMVGATGNATGNHLHLEFRSGSTKINPLKYYPNFA